MRHVARVGMVLTILFAGIVLPGSAAQACRCAPGKPPERVERADAVFYGEIVDRTPIRPDEQGAAWVMTKTYIVDVEQVFKGKVYAEQTLMAGGSSSACGLTLPASGSVLVYATRAPGGEGRPARYTTSLCSGSEVTNSLPGFLGEGDPPIGAMSAYNSQLTIETDADDGEGAMPVVVGGIIVALITTLAAAAAFMWRRRPSGGAA